MRLAHLLRADRTAARLARALRVRPARGLAHVAAGEPGRAEAGGGREDHLAVEKATRTIIPVLFHRAGPPVNPAHGRAPPEASRSEHRPRHRRHPRERLVRSKSLKSGRETKWWDGTGLHAPYFLLCPHSL